jgi:hypothetical protein
MGETPPPPEGHFSPQAAVEALRAHHEEFASRAAAQVTAWGFPPLHGAFIGATVTAHVEQTARAVDRTDLPALDRWAPRRLDQPGDWLDEEAADLAEQAIRGYLADHWLWIDPYEATPTADDPELATLVRWTRSTLESHYNLVGVPDDKIEDAISKAQEELQHNFRHKYSLDSLRRYLVETDEEGTPHWKAGNHRRSYIKYLAPNRFLDTYKPATRRIERYTQPAGWTGQGPTPADRSAEPGLFNGAVDDPGDAMQRADPDELANLLRQRWGQRQPDERHRDTHADLEHRIEAQDFACLARAITGATPEDIAADLNIGPAHDEPAAFVAQRLAIVTAAHSCLAASRPATAALRDWAFTDCNRAAMTEALTAWLVRWPPLEQYASTRQHDATGFARLIAARVTANPHDPQVESKFPTPRNRSTTLNRLATRSAELGRVFHTLLYSRGPADARTRNDQPPQCPCQPPSD